MEKRNLKGLSLLELQNFVESLGEKKYRGVQLFHWLYNKGVQSIDEMTDISKEFRALLKETATLSNLQIIHQQNSSDGTTKFLFQLDDARAIESVLIPPQAGSPSEGKRLTLCVSTQVGCPLGCKFCATGFMGFKRNLTAGEIVDQVLQVQRSTHQRITNIVFMGMGEPFLNYENVLKAIAILNDDRGLTIGARHITISTAGIIDGIRRLAEEECGVKLALSLHTLDPQKREELMPITKKYPLPQLLDALEYYYHKTHRRPTLEYILFHNFNDSEDDVKKLSALHKRIPCKVNLIPFHSIDFVQPSGISARLEAASNERIERFADALRRENLTVMVRSSSGKDIRAACGQLAIVQKQKEEHYVANAV